MLQSIIVYSTVSLLLCFLGWHINRREQLLQTKDPSAQLPFWSWEIVVSIMIVTLMMGLRFKTGSDYEMYLNQYNSVKETGEFARGDLEPGFYLVTKLFVAAGIHYAFYFAFWAFIQISALYFGLRHHKHLLPWVGMILILGPYGFNWISFMRQWTVALVLVAMIPLIEKRRFIPYLVITLVAMTIHRSAWLLMVIYFLSFIKLKDDSPKVPLIVFGICVILGIYPIWFKLFRFVPDLLDIIGYHKYGHHLVDVMNGDFRNIGWGPLHLISLFSSILFICYYPKIKIHFNDDNSLPVIYNLAFVGTCYENLVMNTYHAMLRPAEYLYIFIIIMLAYTFSYILQKKLYIQIILFSLIIVSYSLILHFKAVSGINLSDSSFFYNFIFCIV